MLDSSSNIDLTEKIISRLEIIASSQLRFGREQPNGVVPRDRLVPFKDLQKPENKELLKDIIKKQDQLKKS
jgi:hypothetical protein